RGVGLVGGALAAADRDHLVSGRDQPRHEVGADMPASADDHDAHGYAPPDGVATASVSRPVATTAPRPRLAPVMKQTVRSLVVGIAVPPFRARMRPGSSCCQ